MLKILFRGDSRDPGTLFITGFQAREPREIREGGRPDFTSFSSYSDRVAFSKIFEATAYFGTARDTSEGVLGEKNFWIYIVAIDIEQRKNKYFDIQAESLSAEDTTAEDIAHMEWAQEVVVDQLSSKNILCAVPIIRSDLNAFTIAGNLVSNPSANELLKQNPNLSTQLERVIKHLTDLQSQSIAIPSSENRTEDKKHKTLRESEYFLKNRFNPDDLKSVKAQKNQKIKLKCNASFFKNQKRNPHGVMFTNSTLEKHALAFFTHVKSGKADERINSMEASQKVEATFTSVMTHQRKAQEILIDYYEFFKALYDKSTEAGLWKNHKLRNFKNELDQLSNGQFESELNKQNLSAYTYKTLHLSSMGEFLKKKWQICDLISDHSKEIKDEYIPSLKNSKIRIPR
jgi:hypothetical protein